MLTTIKILNQIMKERLTRDSQLKDTARHDAKYGRSRPQALIALAFWLGGICLFGTVGCAHQPTEADYQKIYNDNSLSTNQKEQAIENLTPDPLVLEYEQALPYLVIGIILLVVGLVVKKKSDSAAHAQMDAAAAGTGGSNKPTVRSAGATKQPDKRQVNDKKHKAEPTKGPPASYLARNQEQDKPVNKLPETQAEVDAVPESQRGISYFTSRPLPKDALAEVTIPIGNEPRTVVASKEEVEQCLAGQIPRVRAFTVDGSTIPWYEWDMYDPYAHYVVLKERDWLGMTNGVVACWLKTENCNSSLWGYYDIEDVDEGELGDYAVELDPELINPTDEAGDPEELGSADETATDVAHLPQGSSEPGTHEKEEGAAETPGAAG